MADGTYGVNIMIQLMNTTKTSLISWNKLMRIFCLLFSLITLPRAKPNINAKKITAAKFPDENEATMFVGTIL